MHARRSGSGDIFGRQSMPAVGPAYFYLGAGFTQDIREPRGIVRGDQLIPHARREIHGRPTQVGKHLSSNGTIARKSTALPSKPSSWSGRLAAILALSK